jgi:hypothetical protein
LAVKKYFLTCILAFLMACGGNGPERPDVLYEESRIASIMKELYLLEAKIRELPIKSDSSKVIFTIYERRIFEQYNVDTADYRASFKYYMNDPEALARIYEILADSLSLQERLNSSPESNTQEPATE